MAHDSYLQLKTGDERHFHRMDRTSNGGETGATHLAAHASDAATYDFAQHPAAGGEASSIGETSLRSDLDSQTPILSHTLLAPVLSTSPLLPRRQSSLTHRSPEAPSLQGSEMEVGQGALSTRVSKMKAAEADLRRYFGLADGEVGPPALLPSCHAWQLDHCNLVPLLSCADVLDLLQRHPHAATLLVKV